MKHLLLPFLIGLLLISGCKEDEIITPDPPDTRTKPAVTTQAPTNVGAGFATFNGTVTDDGGATIVERGFVWGPNPAPTSSDNGMPVSGTTGSFSSQQFGLFIGATYYVRAYARNVKGTTYGDDIMFTTPDSYELTNTGAKDIGIVFATLQGTIESTIHTDIDEKGFVVSTDPDPEDGAPGSISYIVSGNSINDYEYYLTNLTHNTTYYYRPYGRDGNNNLYQGDISNFKTCGYFGEANGVVFYDKGETSNGWRYLEVSQNDIAFGTGKSTEFGCMGTLILVTKEDIGTGLENSQQISNACSDANCAARICLDHSEGGKDDWFLGSSDEHEFLERGNLGLLSFNDAYWTSTEVNANTAYRYLLGGAGVSPWAADKDVVYYVRPMRRY